MPNSIITQMQRKLSLWHRVMRKMPVFLQIKEFFDIMKRIIDTVKQNHMSKRILKSFDIASRQSF